MDRRRFLVTTSVASLALAGPHAVFAGGERIARTRLVRGPRETLFGAPGGCAGSRARASYGGPLTMKRMLSLAWR